MADKDWVYKPFFFFLSLCFCRAQVPDENNSVYKWKGGGVRIQRTSRSKWSAIGGGEAHTTIKDCIYANERKGKKQQ